MIKNIMKFDSANEVIQEYRPELVDTLDSEIFQILEHVNDFESLVFVVVDGAEVLTVDSISGDVYSTEPIDKFIQESIDYANEEGSNA